jgi:hypothetical protein
MRGRAFWTDALPIPVVPPVMSAVGMAQPFVAGAVVETAA